MIDTLNVKLDIEYLNPDNTLNNPLKGIIDRLGGQWTEIPPSFRNFPEPTYERKYRNYRAVLTPYGLTLTGSLSKFYLGNNCRPLTPADIKKAVAVLCSEVNAPLEKAVVKRIDFAFNVAVDNPVLLYLDSLEFKNKRKVSRVDNSLYYKGTGKQLAFYDKYKELKRDPLNLNFLTLEDISKKLLRYELRLLNLKHFFKGRVVLLENLEERDFYDTCLRLWVKGLLECYSGVDRKVKLKPFRNFKEFWWQLYLIGIMEMGGFTEAINEVDLMRRMKKLRSPSNCKKRAIVEYKEAKRFFDKGESTKGRLVREMKRKLIQGAFVHSRR